MILLAIILAVTAFVFAGFAVWPAARLQPRWLAPSILAGLAGVAASAGRALSTSGRRTYGRKS